MAFKEDFQKLVAQVMQRRQFVVNEEMTKQSLIIPFIQTLGYDVFDPQEVRPEYSAGFAKNKEKIDYAVFKEGKVVMFIEAKPVSDSLSNHDAQLAKYFNSTPEAKLAVITNGIRYKFFTDLNEANIMDSTPFLEIDLEQATDSDIQILKKFKKEFFDVGSVISFAEELVYVSKLKRSLKEQLKNPSDDFIRFLVKEFSDTRLTASVVERFRPIVKKAITTALLEIVSQGILNPVAEYQEQNQPIEEEDTVEDEDETEEDAAKPRILTTDEEIEAFNTIKKILAAAGKDADNLQYKDTINYFAVFTRNINHWFIRINLDYINKNVITRLPVEEASDLASGLRVEPAPKGLGQSRIIISSISDLEKLNSLILKCYEEHEIA